MELALAIIQLLASSLTTTQFILVVLAIIMLTGTLFKFFLSLTKKKGGVLNKLIGNDEQDSTDKKLDTLLSSHDYEDSVMKIFTSLDEIKHNTKLYDTYFKEQITELAMMKKDLEQLHEATAKSLEDLKHQAKMHDVSEMQASETLKSTLQRGQDIMHRVASQLEKVDEFTRAAVPEFRSYHKELSKEVSDLSRDIALVERSIQNQVNTNNSIKLR